MDFEFSHDIYGKPVARFSMGHEAIGRWTSEEPGNENRYIVELLTSIERLETRQSNECHLIGTEFEIRFDHDEVEVSALALNQQTDEVLPEDTNLNLGAHYAECGLQYFKAVILSWQHFVCKQVA